MQEVKLIYIGQNGPGRHHFREYSMKAHLHAIAMQYGKIFVILLN